MKKLSFQKYDNLIFSENNINRTFYVVNAVNLLIN